MDDVTSDSLAISSALAGVGGAVAGRYRVRARLGRGATKEVYLAYDERLDRDVALAMVLGAGDDDATRARLTREAQVMGRLGDHPNIITIHDTGEINGVPYLVMRAMSGGSLADLLSCGRPSLGRTMQLGREIALGLAHAHAHGIVHRDVKPDNVWLAGDGSAALGDFGIAIRDGHARLTAEGVVVGTVRYLSPEQIRGEDVGPASDLYALGVTLYELVTGRPPFVAHDTAQVLAQHLASQPMPPSDRTAAVPPALDELILRLLAKQPAQRPGSADCVEQELAAIVRALGPSGELERGPSQLSDGVSAVAAAHVSEEREAQARFALPPALTAHERGIFVGRESDIERLWLTYERASGGARQVVFLRGEPGIGKTRLATELAVRARDQGAVVLYGHCDEEPLVPHQAFVEALHHYVATCPLPELARQIGAIGRSSGELRRVVPELGERLPTLAQPLAGDADGERYRLFTAVSALLCTAARARPVVLVVDDLHWADKPSLLLLRHLIRSAHEISLLVLGTYRETELEPGHPLSKMLADLSRDDSLNRHSLRRLDQAAVGRLVTAQAGRDAPELARMVFDGTEGNPFFVVEMLRHMAESGELAEHGEPAPGPMPGEWRIPEGIKDVIGRRITRLGHATQAVLSVASVAGRDFRSAVLERINDLDDDELLAALEEATRAQLIEEVASRPGRYTFAHALIRETIYRGLSGSRRALLHRRVAASLEDAHAADLEPYLPELVHHFAHAGSARDLEKAIEYGARAGDRAVAQLAYEQAAAHFRQAAGIIEAAALPRQAQRCDLVIAQGEAERHAGDPAYRATLLEGARLAQGLGDADRLARATLANNRGFFSATAGVDRERVSALQAALDAHGVTDSAMRASLLAQLAVELVADCDWPRRRRLSDDALAMARRVGDPTTLVRTLNHRFAALWGPRTLHERLSNTDEAQLLAEGLEDPMLAFQAANFGSHAAMEAGDLALADRRLACAGEIAERLGQPIIDWYVGVGRVKRSLISGQPDEAEQLAHAAYDAGRRARQPDAFAWFSMQLVVARFLRGGLDGGRPNLLEGAMMGTPYDARDEPSGSRSVPLLFEAVCAVIFSEVGRSDDARKRFDGLMQVELADLPHDWATLVIPALASLTCAYLGDERRAVVLYATLEPHAGQFVDSGPSWFGATTHHLALLANTLGRPDEADVRFAEAIGAYERLGARPWLARAQLDWARALVARGRRVDGDHAEELLTRALDIAHELDLAKVERESASLLGQLVGAGRPRA